MKEYSIEISGDFSNKKYDLFEIENNKTNLLLENKSFEEIENKIKIELTKEEVKALNLLAKNLKANFVIKMERPLIREYYYHIYEKTSEGHLSYKAGVNVLRESLRNQFTKYLLPFAEKNAISKLKTLKEEKEKLENRLFEIDNEIYDYGEHLEKKVKSLISNYIKRK